MDDLRRLEKKVDRLLTIMEDDPRSDRKGYFSKQEDLTKRVDALETQNKVSAGKKTVYLTIGGGVMWLATSLDQVVEAIKRLFPHKFMILLLAFLL